METIKPIEIKAHCHKQLPKKIRSDAVIRAQRKYYQKNKEARNKYTNEYHKTWNLETKTCSCGLEIKNYSWVKHAKSKKHLKRIDNMRL